MTHAQPFLLEFWERTKALSLAVAVHALAAALIVVGTLDWKPFKPPTQITGMSIEAVMVDTQSLIDKRNEAIQQAEAAQRQEERRQQRQRELEAQRERQRIAAEEQAAAEAEQERIEAQRKREADMRLQALRDQQDRERQEELDRQQKEIEELQKQRAEIERQRKLEEERLKQLEQRREAEADAQRQAEAETQLQQQLAAEQAEFRAGELADLNSQYSTAIQAQVTNNWLRPPTAQSGLRCTLNIVQIPGGEVISARIKGTCNADEATRRSLVAAVERAGALPYRGFEDVFTREIDFIFTYDGN